MERRVVYARAWNDVERLRVLVAVRLSVNGILEVAAAVPPVGQVEWSAWWKWKADSADTFYQYVDALATLEGWQPSFREVIFENVAARKAARLRRWITKRTGEDSQGKGSVTAERHAAS